MKIKIKVPSPGESVTEVEIASWLKKDGEYVEKDEPLCSLESDKVTLDLVAEDSGQLKILVQEGETVDVGTVVAEIDTDIPAPERKEVESALPDKEPASPEKRRSDVQPQEPQRKIEPEEKKISLPDSDRVLTSEKGRETEEVISGKGAPADEFHPEQEAEKPSVKAEDSAGYLVTKAAAVRGERRKRLSRLRRKLAERLVAVKNQTAMLTTFNEADMSAIIQIRNRNKEEFKKIHQVGLGYMSFFTKAVVEALTEFPEINASIEGDEIVYHDYMDIGIAVSTERGLMVPVIRNAEQMNFAEIEKTILELATKARENRISIEELSGGTFTITNGGVFGSLLSTPIINPPQSAILGMHAIRKRPVVVNDSIEIRPMMYLALSYDHRIVDGKDSVNFLVRLKGLLEDPSKLLVGF